MERTGWKGIEATAANNVNASDDTGRMIKRSVGTVINEGVRIMFRPMRRFKQQISEEECIHILMEEEIKETGQ